LNKSAVAVIIILLIAFGVIFFRNRLPQLGSDADVGLYVPYNAMTEAEYAEYLKIDAAARQFMKSHGMPILPQNVVPEVEVTQEPSKPIQDFISHVTVAGEFKGNLDEMIGVNQGTFWYPLKLKLLHVDYEWWLLKNGKVDVNGELTKICVAYYAAMGMYPNVMSSRDGEIEAEIRVWDWTCLQNPVLKVSFLSGGGAKYRFAFDSKVIAVTMDSDRAEHFVFQYPSFTYVRKSGWFSAIFSL